MIQHENYKELIWRLAKTDFKLRYHGSFLGYIWAILKPLMIFAILNFVFSHIFARGQGIKFYPLQLLTGVILFNFFTEGTTAGMRSLLSKSELVSKIYIPRWTLILASTINSLLVFLMNIIVLAVFFTLYNFLPSFSSITIFSLYIFLAYFIILSFSLFTAPWYVYLRDLAMIWEVLTMALFYATPIIYPLQMLPLYIQRILLINPMAFIIHFSKEGLINNHFADLWQNILFILITAFIFILSALSYRKFEKKVAENI